MSDEIEIEDRDVDLSNVIYNDNDAQLQFNDWCEECVANVKSAVERRIRECETHGGQQDMPTVILNVDVEVENADEPVYTHLNS